jgi:uncharacterized protein (DUF3820 family)
MTDNDIMPYGLHKGQNMINVPSDYLIYLYENNKAKEPVLSYIKDNLDALKLEIKKK